MVAEKILRFQGRNKDLNQLAQQIGQQLESEGYKTQQRTVPLGNVIQAQKAGILRDIITADLWTQHVERGIAKEITQLVEGTPFQQTTQ